MIDVGTIIRVYAYNFEVVGIYENRVYLKICNDFGLIPSKLPREIKRRTSDTYHITRHFNELNLDDIVKKEIVQF